VQKEKKPIMTTHASGMFEVSLSGKMEIKIDTGKHFYEFEYILAEAP
jgi:hypothetical protein